MFQVYNKRILSILVLALFSFMGVANINCLIFKSEKPPPKKLGGRGHSPPPPCYGAPAWVDLVVKSQGRS